MKKSKEKLSAQELLNLLSSQWADTETLMKIGCVGYNKALDIKKEIVSTAESEGYYLPRGLVPMEMVVDYFKINISYLKKFVNKEGK